MTKPETPSDKFRVDIQALRQAAQVPGRNTVRSLWFLALLFVASLALAAIWIDSSARDVIERLELNRVRIRAETLATLIERELEHAQTVLRSIEDRQRFRQAWARRDFAAMQEHVQEVFNLDRELLAASVFDIDGTLHAEWHPSGRVQAGETMVGQGLVGRGWLRAVIRNNRPYVSGVFQSPSIHKKILVAVAVPILDEDNHVAGVLAAAYTTEELRARFQSLYDSGSKAYAVDQQGAVAAATDSQSLGKPFELPSTMLTTEIRAGKQGSGRIDEPNDMFVGYAPVATLGWAAVYARPASQAMELAAVLRSQGMWAAAFLTLLYILTTGIALNLVRKQAALLSANVSLNERLQAAREHLEERVHERTTELYDSEQRYRLLFKSNPHPMWIYDRESLRFLAVNDAAVQHYGYSAEEFMGLTIKDIRPPETVPALLKQIASAPPEQTTAGIWKHKRKDGGLLDVEISSREITWKGRPARLVLASDVTDREQLQKQFLQSQKMEAIGHLAGGIAHDFNNLLGVILGYCELLLMSGTLQGPSKMQVEEVKKAGERAATLTRQLLAFSRKQIVEPVALDLNTLISEMSRMLARMIGEDIQLMTVLSPNLGRVKADPGQMEQVLMNLAVNARDAMPRGGKLTIETANVELDEKYAQKHISVVPGEYVMLAVADTGFGMDEGTLSHIFEPFFTTKSAEKGTGLGLATVYGIVKQSGGNIWVYSELNRGTTFKIYLPRVTEAVSPVRAPEAGQAPGGKETILLVEDAPAMRRMACEFLATRGYTVLEAKDGAEALAKVKEHTGRIHLLLTDVVMPGMSGRELAEQILRTNPDIKVLYMSGYTGDAVVRDGILEGAAAFIQKPFTLHNLAVRVRETLDAQPAH